MQTNGSEIRIQIETGLLSSLAFINLRVLKFIQSGIARLFWGIAILPFLQLAKFLNAEKTIPQKEHRHGNTKPFVVLDRLKWHHNTLWAYLRIAFKINAALSGHQGRLGDLYEFLLNWNMKVPLIGFIEDKTTFIIELLSNFLPNNKSRESDFVWLSVHKRFGTFQIVERFTNTNSDAKTRIRCIWLSGDDVGKTFELSKLPDLTNKPNVTLPTTVYFPPKMAVLFIELLFSASAIIALFQLTRNSWEVFASPIKNDLKMLATWLFK